jgi:hypothetical protein
MWWFGLAGCSHDASAGWSPASPAARISPAANDSRKQNHQTTLVRLECWAFDLSGCHDQLLPQQAVLGDELLSRPRQTPQQPHDPRQGANRFVTTKPVSPVRMRRPSVDNSAGWFCSKSGNRSSLAQMGKFNDHLKRDSERPCNRTNYLSVTPIQLDRLSTFCGRIVR